MSQFWNDPSKLQPKQQHRWIVSFGNHDSSTAFVRSQQNIALPPHFIKSVDKPSFSNKIVQAKYLYSHTFNFPTRVIWNPIKITLYDAYTKYDDNADINRLSFYENPYVDPVFGGLIAEDVGSDPVYFSTQLFFAIFLQQSGYWNPEELALDDKLLRFRDYTFKEDMINSLISVANAEGRIINDFKGNPVDTRKYNSFNIHELDGTGKIIETWKLYNPLISDVSFDKLDYSTENVLTVNATIAYDWAELAPTISQGFEVQTQITSSKTNKDEKPKLSNITSKKIIDQRPTKISISNLTSKNPSDKKTIIAIIDQMKKQPETITRQPILGIIGSKDKKDFEVLGAIRTAPAPPEEQE
jgi:hypothetical protein